jgi:hypothetical protein
MIGGDPITSIRGLNLSSAGSRIRKPAKALEGIDSVIYLASAVGVGQSIYPGSGRHLRECAH